MCILNNKIAVKDIIKCIPNIKYKAYSEKEIKKQFYDWKQGLTFKEKKTIVLYRFGNLVNSKYSINAKLRKGNLTNRNEDNVKTLSGALKKTSISHNIAVYRNVAATENEWLSNFNIGDKIQFKDFKGTHVDKFIYSKSASSYIAFLIPKGYNCAYVNFWVRIYREKELLINKESTGTLLKIEKVFNKNCYIIELQN